MKTPEKWFWRILTSPLAVPVVFFYYLGKLVMWILERLWIAWVEDLEEE